MAKTTQMTTSDSESDKNSPCVYVIIAVEQVEQQQQQPQGGGIQQDCQRLRQNSSSPSLSSDSAIGSSPSICNVASANNLGGFSVLEQEWQFCQLRMAYSLFCPQNGPSKISVVDLDSENAPEQLKMINDEALVKAKDARVMLVSTSNNIRQLIYPLISAIHLIKYKENQDSPLPIPALFHSFAQLRGVKREQSLEERVQTVLDMMESETKDKENVKFSFMGKVQSISQKYTPAVCTDAVVESETVVKMRGLPWQTTDTDIAFFFAGLNVEPGGIALCLSPEGRRNGEALVRFENAEQRELALQRHRKFLYSRYIEIYRATGVEFTQMAYGLNPDARRFASNKKAAMIVRMRGLPFTCTEQQIREFFSTEAGEPNGGIVDEGVLFVNRQDGRPSGDAFVLFAEESVGKRAVISKNKQRIGTRYIELFRTTAAEVQQLFNRQTSPNINIQQTVPFNNNNNNNNNNINVPAQRMPKMKDCIRLRGLPYEAQVDQVVAFLGEHAKRIVFQGVHMIYTNQGQPSGEAFIQMDSEASASAATIKMHNKYMELGKKKRYIEVFQCCADDMNLMLSAAPLCPPSLTQFVPFPLQPTTNFLPFHITPPAVTGIGSPVVPPPGPPLFPTHHLTMPINNPNDLAPIVTTAGCIPFPNPMVYF